MKTLQQLTAHFYLLASLVVFLSPLPELKLAMELLSKVQTFIERSGGCFLIDCSQKETGEVSINRVGPTDTTFTECLGVFWEDLAMVLVWFSKNPIKGRPHLDQWMCKQKYDK